MGVAGGCAGQTLPDAASRPAEYEAGAARDATAVEMTGPRDDGAFDTAALAEATSPSQDGGDPDPSDEANAWVGPAEAGDEAAESGGDAAVEGVDASNQCDSRSFYCEAARACCDRATEYCHGPHPPMEAACVSYFDAGHPIPPACVASRSCACLEDAGWGEGMCRCLDLDDAGAIGLSCFGCYGSPPARLERFLRAS
jgi:hypothetical protein